MLLSLMVMVVVKTNTDHCPDGLVIVLKSGAVKCVPRGKREAKTCPDGQLLIVLKSGAEKCVPRGKREASDGPMVHKKKREIDQGINNFKACVKSCYQNADCIYNCYGN